MESGSVIETLEDATVEFTPRRCQTLEKLSVLSTLSVNDETLGFQIPGKGSGSVDCGMSCDANESGEVDANDSRSWKDLPKEGISLIVEVFGPLDGTVENGASDQEQKFCVGDLVWVKTSKAPLWWPGIISDQTDGFLVKHFGSNISARCPASEMKPFVECFEELSQLSKSQSFLGAVEMAVLEIGHRIKQQMSCSCSPKERKKISRGRLGFFSVSAFDPADFLESIRCQAVDISRPSGVDLAVIKNCLSAFYSSLGHKQLPLYKLRPRNEGSDGNDAKEGELNLGESSIGKDGKPLELRERKKSKYLSYPFVPNLSESSIGKDEKLPELRERKKSKYLSYPYVNTWDKKGSTSKEETEGDDSHARVEKTKSTVDPRKKSTKTITFKSIYGKLESIDASLTEMLQKLHLTALDCLYPNGSKDSISAMNFFYNFRKQSFLNQNFTSEGNSPQHESPPEIDAANSEGDQLSSPPTKGRGSRKKKEVVNGTTEGGKVYKKRKMMEAAAAPGQPEIPVIDGLPDLNSNSMSLSVENMEVTGPDMSKGKLEPKRAKHKDAIVLGLKTNCSELHTVNVPVVGPHAVPPLTGPSLAVKPEPKKRKREEKAPFFFQNSPPGVPDLNGNVTGQPQPKKRRRRIKSDTGGNTLLLNFSPGHLLPSKESLNATFIKFGPVVEPETQFISDSSARVVFTQSSDAEAAYKSLQTGSPFGPALASYSLNSPPAAKPQRRWTQKRRATGNTLLLNFAPGHPLPSKESLNDTFIKFGPVVEPETQFLSSSSAKIVFSRSCDAEGACQSLQKSSPFGPSLASCRLHCPAVVNNCRAPSTVRPVDALKLPVLPSGTMPLNGEAPDLVYIKKNMEMMRAMLDTAGDNIAPEMKAKLESEVKGFLKKVSSMVDSSSS